MSKSYKLGENYIDSTGIVHNRELLSDILNRTPNKVHVTWEQSMTFKLTGGQQALLILNHDHLGIAWIGGDNLLITNIYGSGINGSKDGDFVTINLGGNYFSGTAYISD